MFIRKTFFALLIIMLSTFIFSQSDRGMIRGKILTEDGNAISGVLVRGTGSGMIGKTETTSDKNGVYRLFNLPQGVYILKFECEGYTTIIKDRVELKFGQTLKISVQMRSGDSKDVFIDKSKNPTIDVKSTLIKKNLNKEIFDRLPKGRDFSTIISIVPGATNEPMLSGISIDGASGIENMFYIDGVDITDIRTGVQGQSVAFDFIDSLSVKTDGYMAEYAGAIGGVISAVTRSGGNEFHGDLTAYYSGTALNGKPREILSIDRNDWSKATYYSSEELYGDVQSSRYEVGFSLGGYVLKDKVWFFGSFLPKFTKYTNDVTYNDSSGTKSHETNTKSMNYMIKVTAQILSNVRWSASYINNFYNRRGYSPWTQAWGPFGNISTNYDNYGFDWPKYSASTALDISIGNNSNLNIRAGMFYTNQENSLKPIPDVPLYRFRESAMGAYSGTNNLMFPEIPANLQHTTYWQNYGFYDSQALVKNIAEKKSISVDYTLYFNAGGEHSVKLGAQFVRQGEDVDKGWQQPLIYLGWDRSALAYGTDYGRGTYGYYVARGTEATGSYGEVYKAYSNRIALYLQDSWTIREKLTINFGVRTESEYIPSYSDNPEFADEKPIDFGFGDKIAPRLGFVYDVKGDSTLKVFGSYGLFFDVMKLDKASGSYGGFGWKDVAYTMDDYDYTKITKDNFPGTFLYLYDFRIPSFISTDPGLKPMSQQAISLGVENKLNDDLLFSVRLVQKHLRYTIEDVLVLTPYGAQYFTTNPGFGWSLMENKLDGSSADPPPYPDTPKAKREYYAVNITLDKRFSNNWMGGFSYTWSRLEGNYSGLPSLDEPGSSASSLARYFDLWYLAFDKEMNKIDGPLATDRTHVIKAYGSYIFPFGLTIGTVINLMSGTPVTEEWNLGAEIFPYGRGNLGRTDMYYNADMYAEYNLKLGKANLQFSVNVTNVFNFKIAQRIIPLKHLGSLPITEAQILSGDWDYPSSAIPNPTFMMPFDFTDPISARIGLKLSF